MIILRKQRQSRLFSRRDILPEEERFTNIPEEPTAKVDIDIVPSKSKWANDRSKLSITDKSIVDKLKNDIKQGHLYDDGPNGGDTHWLKDFSNKDSHLMSKFISYENRLNYRVYKAIVDIDEDGKVKYTIKVVLESCLGHGRDGAKNYSDVSE